MKEIRIKTKRMILHPMSDKEIGVLVGWLLDISEKKKREALRQQRSSHI